MENQPQPTFSGGFEGEAKPANQPTSPGGERPRSKLIPIIAIVVIVIAFIYAANSSNNNEPAEVIEPADSGQVADDNGNSPGVVTDDTINQPTKATTTPVAGGQVSGTPQQPEVVVDKCVVMGCNNEICGNSKQPVITACVALPEYACYVTAVCEKQATGECGWTQTSELTTCIADARFNS